MIYDGIQLLEGSEITNLTVDSGATFPLTPSLGELFYNTTIGALHTYSGTDWVAASGGGGGGGTTATLANATTLGTTNAAVSITGFGGALAAMTISPASSAAGLPLSLVGGASTFTSSVGGALNLTGGNGGGIGGTGGPVVITSGQGETSSGDITIRTGNAAGNSAVGTLTIQGGTKGSGGAGGGVQILGSPVGAGSNTPADVMIRGGDASGGGSVSVGGNAILQGGNSSNSFTLAAGHAIIRGGQQTASTSFPGGDISFQTHSSGSSTFVERLRILGDGSWSVGTGGTATGTSGQVLTSTGAGAPPAWQNAVVGAAAAGTLTGTTLAANVVTSSLTSTTATSFSLGSSGGQGSTTTISTPAFTSNNGRHLTIASGASISSGNPGDLTLIGGAGPSGWRGGHVNITGGPVAAGTSTGGSVLITSGAGSSGGSPGVIRLTVPVGGSGTVAGGYIHVLTAGTERFRILNSGAWSVGSAGTDTGTSGQVLTSTGTTTPPTWQATGASVPALTATRIAFGSAGNSLTSSTDFTFETASRTLSVGNSTSGVINNGSDGGDLRLTTISSVSTAGAIVINPGNSTSSSPANVTISAGSSTASSGSGGHLFLNGGTGSGTGASASGGSAFVRGGSSTNGTGANAGGDATLEGGAANQSGGTSGDAIIMGGTGAAGSIGGIISLWTGPSNTEVERLRIANNGAWGLAGANYGTSGQVLTSAGSTAAPTWATPTTISGSIAESQVTDGALLARNAGNETITGTWSFSNNITVPQDPGVNPGAATSKAYVDNAINGLAWKQSVRAATSPNDANAGNLAALSGLLTVDGITLIAGDRVLVKNQTTQLQNGIYVAAAGAWVRSTDFDVPSDVNGAAVFIREGTLQGRTGWTQTAAVTAVNTDAMNFVVFSATGGAVARVGDTMTGPLIINTNTSTDALQISQAGTGNGLVVQNTTTVGSTPVVINAAGQLLVGTPAAVSNYNIEVTAPTVRVVGAATTGAAYFRAQNDVGQAYIGVDNDVGGLTGTANAGAVWAGPGTPLLLGTNNVERVRVAADGVVSLNSASGTAAASLKLTPGTVATRSGHIEFTIPSNGVRAASIGAVDLPAGGTDQGSLNLVCKQLVAVSPTGSSIIAWPGESSGNPSFSSHANIPNAGGNLLGFRVSGAAAESVVYNMTLLTTLLTTGAGYPEFRYDFSNSQYQGFNGYTCSIIAMTGQWQFATAILNGSDETKKSNWSRVDTSLVDRLANVQAGVYDYTAGGITQKQVGVSAQNMRDALPESVGEMADGTLGVAYANVALVSAVALAKRVKELEAKLERMEKLLHHHHHHDNN